MQKCNYATCNREFNKHSNRKIYCDSEQCRAERERERHRLRRAKVKAAKEASKDPDSGKYEGTQCSPN